MDDKNNKHMKDTMDSGGRSDCGAESQDATPSCIKSKAVVKYSSVRDLANFTHLKCNTDLNLPPSNWLSSSGEFYGLQRAASHSTGFSSFQMAHMFPDCVGEVDVVSTAENIKTLLKIPYTKGPVSMVVHRVEKTLLIDEFDIHKYLLRTSESEWEWIRKFFYEHVRQTLNEKEKCLFHKNNSRNALQQRSLISKFLYRSLAEEDPQSKNHEPDKDKTEKSDQCDSSQTWPPLPEPTPEEKVPDSASDHKFSRNVVWTFEDIRMLIGTDMPIFGDKTHPCVSLRLRDMARPISILTGIDYWLDNLMCNVPELVMCYHLDGIVQKYELIKTEDLPHLENSKFSPRIIRDVAQNILSFLKSNATKAGHTYWLFKGKDEDIVKLYDLTSLCSDVTDDKDQNPFTVPVAMLFYRVARNMKYSPDGHRHKKTILMLLKNCLALLTEKKYPQIVTSVHYMLSDLYVPINVNPLSPETSDEESDSELWRQSAEEEETPVKTMSVAVKSLCFSSSKQHQKSPKNKERKRKSPTVSTHDMDDRCRLSLEHVSVGLRCLKYIDHSDENEENFSNGSTQEADSPKMAHPHQPIPMPYQPLNQTNSEVEKEMHKNSQSEVLHIKTSPNALLCKVPAETIPKWLRPSETDQVFWKLHLKTLLFQKAYLVYIILAERAFLSKQYGRCLAFVFLVLNCNQALECLNCPPGSDSQKSLLLGKAGDSYFMISQDWQNISQYQHDYSEVLENNSGILTEVQKDCISEANIEPSLILEVVDQKEQIMIASHRCYKKSLELETLEHEQEMLKRRLGNIENELGVFYMNQASVLAGQKEKMEEHSVTLQNLFRKSLQHLERGLKEFEEINDEGNLALLYCNKGRLMRMCAHYHSPNSTERLEIGKMERHFYNKAIDTYERALQILRVRKNHKEIWDTVTWEFSSTLFTLGTLLQDYPVRDGRSEEELGREVAELFMKGLKYCDLETPGVRQTLYQFRAAVLHHRLAGLYHKTVRYSSLEETKLKNTIQLAKLHYGKAAALYLAVEQASEYLRVQLELVALIEFQVDESRNYTSKTKHLLNILDVLLSSKVILKYIIDDDHFPEIPPTSTPVISEDVKTEPTNVEVPDDTCVEEVRDDNGEACRQTDKTEQSEVKSKDEEESKTSSEEELSLLVLLEQRLQFVLRNLVKCHMEKTSKNTKKESDIYKKMYSITLRNTKFTSVKALAAHLELVLCSLEEIVRDCNLITKKSTR